MSETLGLIVVVLVILLIIILLAIIYASRRQKHIAMPKPLIGAWGMAETDLAQEGLVLVAGEAWQAIASKNISKGTKVMIIGVQGVLLKVQSIE